MVNIKKSILFILVVGVFLLVLSDSVLAGCGSFSPISSGTGDPRVGFYGFKSSQIASTGFATIRNTLFQQTVTEDDLRTIFRTGMPVDGSGNQVTYYYVFPSATHSRGFESFYDCDWVSRMGFYVYGRPGTIKATVSALGTDGSSWYFQGDRKSPIVYATMGRFQLYAGNKYSFQDATSLPTMMNRITMDIYPSIYELMPDTSDNRINSLSFRGGHRDYITKSFSVWGGNEGVHYVAIALGLDSQNGDWNDDAKIVISVSGDAFISSSMLTTPGQIRSQVGANRLDSMPNVCSLVGNHISYHGKDGETGKIKCCGARADADVGVTSYNFVCTKDGTDYKWVDACEDTTSTGSSFTQARTFCCADTGNSGGYCGGNLFLTCTGTYSCSTFTNSYSCDSNANCEWDTRLTPCEYVVGDAEDYIRTDDDTRCYTGRCVSKTGPLGGTHDCFAVGVAKCSQVDGCTLKDSRGVIRPSDYTCSQIYGIYGQEDCRNTFSCYWTCKADVGETCERDHDCINGLSCDPDFEGVKRCHNNFNQCVLDASGVELSVGQTRCIEGEYKSCDLSNDGLYPDDCRLTSYGFVCTGDLQKQCMGAVDCSKFNIFEDACQSAGCSFRAITPICEDASGSTGVLPKPLLESNLGGFTYFDIAPIDRIDGVDSCYDHRDFESCRYDINCKWVDDQCKDACRTITTNSMCNNRDDCNLRTTQCAGPTSNPCSSYSTTDCPSWMGCRIGPTYDTCEEINSITWPTSTCTNTAGCTSNCVLPSFSDAIDIHTSQAACECAGGTYKFCHIDKDKDSYPFVSGTATRRCMFGTDELTMIGTEQYVCKTVLGDFTGLHDCNDNNPNIYPNAPDICGNSIAENCVADEPCNPVWFNDFDGDGWPANEEPISSVTEPIVAGKKYYISTSGHWNVNWNSLVFDCDDNDPDVYPGAPILCDGKDNNCNGETDVPSPQPSANIQGRCSGNVDACVNGAWVPHINNYIPTSETCNGMDDDCNGLVDDGLSAPLAEKQQGVCAGATKVCAGASDWQEPNYFDYSPDYRLVEECDYLDRNCDGTMFPTDPDSLGYCYADRDNDGWVNASSQISHCLYKINCPSVSNSYPYADGSMPLIDYYTEDASLGFDCDDTNSFLTDECCTSDLSRPNFVIARVGYTGQFAEGVMSAFRNEFDYPWNTFSSPLVNIAFPRLYEDKLVGSCQPSSNYCYYNDGFDEIIQPRSAWDILGGDNINTPSVYCSEDCGPHGCVWYDCDNDATTCTDGCGLPWAKKDSGSPTLGGYNVLAGNHSECCGDDANEHHTTSFCSADISREPVCCPQAGMKVLDGRCVEADKCPTVMKGAPVWITAHNQSEYALFTRLLDNKDANYIYCCNGLSETAPRNEKPLCYYYDVDTLQYTQRDTLGCYVYNESVRYQSDPRLGVHPGICAFDECLLEVFDSPDKPFDLCEETFTCTESIIQTLPKETSLIQEKTPYYTYEELQYVSLCTDTFTGLQAAELYVETISVPYHDESIGSSGSPLCKAERFTIHTLKDDAICSLLCVSPDSCSYACRMENRGDPFEEKELVRYHGIECGNDPDVDLLSYETVLTGDVTPLAYDYLYNDAECSPIAECNDFGCWPKGRDDCRCTAMSGCNPECTAQLSEFYTKTTSCGPSLTCMNGVVESVEYDSLLCLGNTTLYDLPLEIRYTREDTGEVVPLVCNNVYDSELADPIIDGGVWCPSGYEYNDQEDRCEYVHSRCDIGVVNQPSDQGCHDLTLYKDDSYFEQYNANCVAQKSNTLGLYDAVCCYASTLNGVSLYKRDETIQHIRVY